MNLIVCREVKVCFSEHSACFFFLFFCLLVILIGCLFSQQLSFLTSVVWSHIRWLVPHPSSVVSSLGWCFPTQVWPCHRMFYVSPPRMKRNCFHVQKNAWAVHSSLACCRAVFSEQICDNVSFHLFAHRMG